MDNSSYSSIEGTITRVRTTKHNYIQDKIFVIANIRDPWGESHTIRGNVGRRPETGDFITGNFKKEIHELYGEQLSSKGMIDVFLPRDPTAIKKRCRDISKRAQIPFSPPSVVRIIDTYSDSNPVGFWKEFVTFRSSDSILQIRITEIQTAINTYMSQQKIVQSSSSVEQYFTELGLPWSSQIIRKMLGYDTDECDDPENPDREPILLEQLQSDPLCILELLDIRTAQVMQYLDALQRLGIIDQPTVSIGLFIKECMTGENNGSCCIPTQEDRVSLIRDLPKFSEYLMEYNDCLYRKRVYDDEHAVAEFFVDCASMEPFHIFDSDGILKEIQTLPADNGNTPNAKQVNAVNTMMTARISTLQGSAGTGKTTALRLLARYIKLLRNDLRSNILFLAPTGKAVNRIKDSLRDIELAHNDNIMTIHRFAGLVRGFKKDPDGCGSSTPVDTCISSPVFIAVDESSMISLSIMKMFVDVLRLFDYIPHIVFIGDGYQLTPVGAGCPYLDLIESEIAPNTTLDVVHRQGANSALLTAITDLRNAVDVSVSAPGLFEINITKDIEKSMLRWIDAHPTGSTSIIVPTGLRGLVGTLTPIVRDYLNPSSPAVDLYLGDDGDEERELLEAYRIGDKVMQIKNNYARSVFNGDVGVIMGLKQLANHDPPYLLHVKFNGREEDFFYSFPDAGKELMPAYVITTHKSQGSEYDHILIIMDHAIPNFIHRNHIYTAASRGKQSVKILLKERGIMRLWKFTPMKPLTNLVHQIGGFVSG